MSPPRAFVVLAILVAAVVARGPSYGRVVEAATRTAHLAPARAGLRLDALAAQRPPIVADQVNNPAASTTYSCGTSAASLYQGFTPALDTLAAVEVFVRAGGSFPADGVTLLLTVHDGSPAGPVLASASTPVAGPLPPGTVAGVRFDLAAPVANVAGRVLVAELHSPAPAGAPAATVASWLGRDDDPYPRGHAYGCAANDVPANDMNFISYGYDEAQGGLQACPQIAALVPPADIQRALADPGKVAGYDQLADPSKPPAPWNPRRRSLTIERLGAPYHAMFNRLVFRSGCP